jgi:hypothetical protein
MDSKTQFQRDWLDANWDKFVAEGRTTESV